MQEEYPFPSPLHLRRQTWRSQSQLGAILGPCFDGFVFQICQHVRVTWTHQAQWINEGQLQLYLKASIQTREGFLSKNSSTPEAQRLRLFFSIFLPWCLHQIEVLNSRWLRTNDAAPAPATDPVNGICLTTFEKLPTSTMRCSLTP